MKKALLIFLSVAFTVVNISAQFVTWKELNQLPEPVTNNAVTSATIRGMPYVYSFGGIDESKACGKCHLRSFRYNPSLDNWIPIDPLPDVNGGKIASGASTVKNMIYIIGGYHVANNCREVSSNKVHIYNPETNQYLNDGREIPTAIDDHVQAVWRDSLIYVVTGWSNTTNVVDVQIYNPSEDLWMKGTSIPNDPDWKVFGASGTIVGDTIYYMGGASSTCMPGSCFEATKMLRKGVINPNDPTDITWSSAETSLAQGYRMASFAFKENLPIWFGGSDLTYNFDGIDYNGTGGVDALSRMSTLNTGDDKITPYENVIPEVMDLRGVGLIDDNNLIIAGGMEANQKVSDRTYLLTFDNLSPIPEFDGTSFLIYPNPAFDVLNLEYSGRGILEIYNRFGNKVISKHFQGNVKIDISQLERGFYFLRILNNYRVAVVANFIKL